VDKEGTLALGKERGKGKKKAEGRRKRGSECRRCGKGGERGKVYRG